MTEEQLGRVKQAYKIVFRSNLGLAEAIAQLEARARRAPRDRPPRGVPQGVAARVTR